MILRRNGNKAAIAHKITPHFPEHDIYIETFFGAGGMFFNKPKAKYNFLNDIDADVFNLFMIVKNCKDELISAIDSMPVHAQLMKWWKHNPETDPIWRAARFLYLSNFTYLSKGYVMKFDVDNTKRILLDRITPCYDFIKHEKFMCADFRQVLKNICFKGNNKARSFIYSDGPYYETDGFYFSNSNSEQDVLDHFDMLQNSDIRFAMSEFNHPFILDQVKKRGLNLIEIGERQNLKKRSVEVLITNYSSNYQSKLFV